MLSSAMLCSHLCSMSRPFYTHYVHLGAVTLSVMLQSPQNNNVFVGDNNN